MLDDIIYKALKEAGARAGSQLKLSQKNGVSQGQISDYLCGRRLIKNMTVGTLEKLFPELSLTFFQDQNPVEADPVENEIISIIHALSPEQKAYCLRLLAATFPHDTIRNMPDMDQKK